MPPDFDGELRNEEMCGVARWLASIVSMRPAQSRAFYALV